MTAVGINPHPTTPRKQLRAFYARQGLTGKQLRSAMRYDLRQVRRYAVASNRRALEVLRGPMTGAQVWKECNPCGLGIGGMFLFAGTKEGYEYWINRDDCK